jgi:RND family efflux transporter MFP subunit
MKYINSISFIIIITFLCSCGESKKNKDEEHEHSESVANVVELNEAQVQASGIETGTASLRSISNNLKVNGEIASLPQNTASVSFPMGGRIVRINVMQGSSVVKGQTLAVIENVDFIDIQQNYLETKSKLEYTSADYARQQILVKSDATSRKNFQLVKSEYRMLQVQARALEEKLKLIGINPARLTANNIRRSVSVVAPISGYIKSVNISVGKAVMASDPLFDIVNLNKLFLKLTIFEKDIASVVKGQHMQFFINDETETHRAIVYQTSKAIDDDKTYKVYAAIESKCENILPGMYVNAILESKARQVMALPDNAIVSFEGKDYIFVYSGKKKEKDAVMSEYKLVQIKKGITGNGYSEIIFPEGFDVKKEQIVLEGTYNLLSALKNEGEMSC